MTTIASGVPVNPFKQAISQRDRQIGLWLATGDAYVAEMVAGTGFDWLLIDGEHAPNDLRGTLAQLQAIASATSTLPATAKAPHPIVRLPTADPVLVKQYLELGVQTLLLPMIDTPEQAASMASAMRYRPMGNRGIGCGLARSSRWNRFSSYLQEANAQVCLLVQVETVEALNNIDEIAATPGVDGVFIGPADLSASMGFLGQPGHPEVVAAIQKAVARIAAAGKPSGILATQEAQAHQWLEAGVSFAAVGVDISLLSMAAQGLASRFTQTASPVVVSRNGY
ncbi:4-hydroxy-2-oxovalerate aldolase [Comamonas aquatilis]|uniref:aldolase/citrate lyase family protein n=1 Tax=Comamonas aquatilis TaxID=1778406 RepID=UPI0039EE9D4D